MRRPRKHDGEAARPGAIKIEYELSGLDAKHFMQMAKEARKSVSALARSMIRDVIRDDRAAHGLSD